MSDSIKGKNNYALHFTADSNLAIQIGKIEIIDEANNLMSVMLYDLEFYFINQGNEFHNTLRGIDYTVDIDQLSLFGNGISGLFPDIGETIKSKLDVLNDNTLKNTHSNGAVTYCKRK